MLNSLLAGPTGKNGLASSPCEISKFEMRVCRLRFLRGLTYREIAQRLGRSLNAVIKAVQRVRRRCPGFARIFPPYSNMAATA